MRPKSIEKISKNQFKTSIFMTFLIFILLAAGLSVAVYSIQTIRQNRIDSEWNYIQSVLSENEDKAQIEADDVKDNIVEDVTNLYTNKDQLKYDMDNMTVNNKLSLILDQNINGKYLNVQNDNNDIFVISTWQKNDNIDLPGKIIYDKSINCMSMGEIRTFDVELANHYNYDLGHDAIKRILAQDKDKPIFWEYLKNTNPNHIKLSNGSMEGLKQVFISEGIEGLKGYEILTQSNILNDQDLLGNPKVQNDGIYNENSRQIIIVQGFSLYDALMTRHQGRIVDIEKTYELNLKIAFIVSISLILLIIVIFTSVIRQQNYAGEILEILEDIFTKNNSE